MSQVVYKYGPIKKLKEPIEARGKPVHFAMMPNGEFYVWCVVVLPLSEMPGPGGDHILVAVYPTGEDWLGEYIDSYVTNEGFVWHAVRVFE